MDENQDPNEIADIQLNEQEEDFIGQCWDGVQESGKLSLSGLTALTETLGITMDTINVAVTGLGGDDCTMNVDEFMVLMGRLVRSGALQLPGDRDLKDEGGGSPEAVVEENLNTADPEEMANIQLSEAEEVFIGQCWDGVAEDGKISMQGLSALCDTLGITMDTINLAVTNLGDDDCQMGIDDFMVLMGRLVRSGAVAMPGSPTAKTLPVARKATPEKSGWLNAMVAEEEPPVAKMTAAPAGGSTWMSAMAAGEEEDEEQPTKKNGAAAWMASMTVDEQDEDEDEAGEAVSAGGAAWLSAMGGGDPPSGKTVPSATAAWMASMAVGEDEEDEEDDEDAAPVGASKPAIGGANAWLSSMTVNDDGSP